jgi:hypothetical protein
MKNNIVFFIELVVSFLPFILFAFFNAKANVKKERVLHIDQMIGLNRK